MMKWKVTTLKFYTIAYFLTTQGAKSFSIEMRNNVNHNTDEDLSEELHCVKLCLHNSPSHYPCLCANLTNETSLIWQILSNQFIKPEQLKNFTLFSRGTGMQGDESTPVLDYQSSLIIDGANQQSVVNDARRTMSNENGTNCTKLTDSDHELFNETVNTNIDVDHGSVNGSARSGQGNVNGTSNGVAGNGTASDLSSFKDIWDLIKNIPFVDWWRILHALINCDLEKIEAFHQFYFPNGTFPNFNCTINATTTTTTTTTVNPIAEFCRQACLSGNGGASCSCAKYPIG